MEIKFSVPDVNLDWWESSRGELSRILQRENQRSWESEADPNTGTKWAPRKQPTGNWPLLQRTGAMFDKVKVKPQNEVGIFATKSVSYGPFHMTGTSCMTARPWLGVPDSALSPMATAIAKHIFKTRR